MVLSSSVIRVAEWGAKQRCVTQKCVGLIILCIFAMNNK